MIILHILAAAVAITWIATWSLYGALAVTCGLLWLTVSVILVTYLAFLRSRSELTLRTLSVTLLWILAALWLSNEAVQSTANIWSGFHPDPNIGWYPAPDLREHVQDDGQTRYSFSTDSLGHRQSYPYPPDQVIPWMIQGDSNIFGFGLRYSETIGAQLSEAIGDSSLFYNFGVSGFDLHHYYFQYEKWKDEFTIEQRLILFNQGNDLSVSALRTAYFLHRPFIDVTQV